MTQEMELQLFLDTAIPLWIEAYRELSWDERKVILLECEDVFATCSEALLHRIKGKTSKMFNATAKAIAVLSFAPGGVDMFGRHWAAIHETQKPS